MLTWQHEDDDVSGFRIYGSAGSLIDQVNQANVKTYTVAGLKPGERHCYQVVAFNSAGVESAKSNTACATTKPPVVEKPAPPTNVEFSYDEAEDIVLDWSYGDTSKISGFRVYVGGCSGEKRLVTTVSKDDAWFAVIDWEEWDNIDVSCGGIASEWLAGVSAVTSSGVESDIVWVVVADAQ
jgi:hypothetical protein